MDTKKNSSLKDARLMIALLLTAAVLLVCAHAAAGSGEEAPSNVTVIETEVETASETSPSEEGAYSESALAKQIRSYLSDKEESFTLHFASDEVEIGDIKKLTKRLMKKAVSDNGSSVGGDYLRYQYGGYDMDCKKIEDDFFLTITPIYYTTAEQEGKVTEKVSEIISGFHFSKNESDYEKVKAIYEWMCDNVYYDYENEDNSDYKLQYTAYGALVNKTAVCQGYAVAFYRLCEECGIDCRVIEGEAQYVNGGESGRHAWNIVEIDGKWYLTDVTWDSVLGDYGYFLKADYSDHEADDEFLTESFAKSHPMAESDY